jgi:hypothetical protein
VATIIHFVTHPHSRLTRELMLAGHLVFEATNIEELLAVFQDARHTDLILIDADVKEGRARATTLGSMILVFDHNAAIHQVLLEIERIFPRN